MISFSSKSLLDLINVSVNLITWKIRLIGLLPVGLAFEPFLSNVMHTVYVKSFEVEKFRRRPFKFETF